jgi:two-component system OmpR family response regulator
VRLLLVEDDRSISSFIMKGFKQAGFVVEHAEDGEEGLFLAQRYSYDAAIVDIMLPKLDGLSMIEALRAKKVKIPILILSAKSAVDDRIRGLKKGGDDYVTKPFSFSELLVRVQSLIRRSSMADSITRLTYSDLTMDLVSREVTRGTQRIELQPREFSLLEYLIRHTGTVVSKTMIMEHVWGYDFDPQTNPVDVLVHRLRSKIETDPNKKLIYTVRGIGYVLKKS